jgi:hypothetical protein
MTKALTIIRDLCGSIYSRGKRRAIFTINVGTLLRLMLEKLVVGT